MWTKLAEDLARRIAGEVRFDAGSRALYATDASNYRMPPVGVVIPKTIEDVVETVTLARRHGAPILARGGGTSLAGQTCNTAVIIDFSKYLNHILEIDSRGKRAWVEPGVILDSLRDEAEKHHLTFGPDPATHDHNTLGGMIGNNSCGVHSVMAGRTSENVEQLEILTYDGLRMWVGETSDEQLRRIIDEGGRRGDIYRRLKGISERYGNLIRARFPEIPRRVSGYNLPELLPEHRFNVARALIGSEGTCVTVLQAALRLVDSPPCRVLVVLGYPDVYQAGDHVAEIRESGCIGLEGFDDDLLHDMQAKDMHPEDLKILPDGNGFLMVEFGGETQADAEAQARGMMEALKRHSEAPSMALFTKPAAMKKLWEVREAGLAATARVPGKADAWPGWEDSAVPPANVGKYLRELKALFQRYSYQGALYGHFGDGCIHCRIDFDLKSTAGIEKWRRFLDDAADLVLRYDGSLSGEHGDGQARADLLPRMFGPELMEAFHEFKAIWDPNNRMNPGKVVNANPITANLRLSASAARPWSSSQAYAYRNDDGSFHRAVMRCVGVGKCRHLNGGVMCPSFMATREEQHSTRGRARALFEMMQGEVITDGWKSEAVREALDLCLCCKGCKRDCPVGVDMASYKSEFLSHYYRGRLRPRSAYAMGLIHWWARAAAKAPRVANFFAATPGIDRMAKTLAGIAPERRIPTFAPTTFRQRLHRRGARNPGAPPVVLWPDTFNEHFHPETAMAAVEVLEAAGYRVVVPEGALCCARPLFAWGMLDLARKQLKHAVDTLAPMLGPGTFLVGLEPACLASFQDELPELLPHDQAAREVSSKARLLSDFLVNEAHWPAPRIGGKALVHLHCYHHAVFGDKSERALLDALGLDYQVLDAGCCGMAGSFGFEADHYRVSIAAAERALLPAVRAADADTLILTNGYSCREQIAQCTTRRATHIAELAARAIGAAGSGWQGG